MALIGAACGAGIALGILAIAFGFRGHVDELPRSAGFAGDKTSGAPPWRVAAAVAGGVVTWAITGWPVAALLAAGAVWVAPVGLAAGRSAVDDAGRAEAIAGWTELLRDTLAAAAGLEQAILASAAAAPEPVREEVTALARRLKRDRIDDALIHFADELANPVADLVVAALITAARREARDLVPLLGALAGSARAEAHMRRRIEVSRARIRTSVRVVAGTLGIFAVGLLVFSRSYLEPYATPTGQLVLVVVATIFGTGWFLLQRMAQIEGPERFLNWNLARERSEP